MASSRHLMRPIIAAIWARFCRVRSPSLGRPAHPFEVRHRRQQASAHALDQQRARKYGNKKGPDGDSAGNRTSLIPAPQRGSPVRSPTHSSLKYRTPTAYATALTATRSAAQTRPLPLILPQVLCSPEFVPAIGFDGLGGGSGGRWRGVLGIAQRPVPARVAGESELGGRFPSELRVWSCLVVI